jgi:hypothetical protein
MSYATDDFDSLGTIEVSFDIDFEVSVVADDDIGDELVEEMMSFDASDMCTGAAPLFNASDDDLLEMFFKQQVESPAAVRARRKRAAASNDAQLALFA